MGQAPLTQKTTLRVYPVLWCPLWPCHHRMCVIGKETGHEVQGRATGHCHITQFSCAQVPLESHAGFVTDVKVVIAARV